VDGPQGWRGGRLVGSVVAVLWSQEARDFNISLFSAIANYFVVRLNKAAAKALARNVAGSD
jgi:DNA phosphorothioation-dependent restriction protein DptH